jgi:REP element-mobilizing transposase RayT
MRRPNLYSKTFYHIYNRGVSKRTLFKSDEDYKYFMYKLAKFKKKYTVEVISFCLMPNHFHLLARTQYKKENISKFMKSLQLSYAIYFNKKNKHAGHVFQGAYKNKMIRTQISLAKVIQYIANNPVKKKLVVKPDQWPYAG